LLQEEEEEEKEVEEEEQQLFEPADDYLLKSSYPFLKYS
jgi:hypothetical protein